MRLTEKQKDVLLSIVHRVTSADADRPRFADTRKMEEG